jgi:tripartite-type tricarboxylate transporter receptor subunit TctC
MTTRIIATALLLTGLTGAPALAQAEYPTRPVRIVVPSEPGGGTDISARILADRLSQAMGQQFVIENRPGAGQMIGTEQVARAPNDGYTLLVAAAAITILPAINANVKFDILRDFAPVSQLVSSPSVLVAPANLPYKTLKDFIAGVKAKPGAYNFGSAGVGTQPHMAFELFRVMAGLDMQHIPYKGIAPALNGVIAGQVAASIINPLTAKPQVDAGKVLGLGISSAQRSPMMPEIPAIAEAVPGYEAIQWFGLFAPAGTPAPVVARLHKEIAAALKSPEMQKRVAADGATAVGNSPAEFSAQIKSEFEKWAKVAEMAKLKK